MELGVHEIEFVVSFDLFLFFKSYLYNLRQSKNAAKHMTIIEKRSQGGVVEEALWERDR